MMKARGGVYCLGDADMDGELSIIDVTYLQRYLAKIRELDDEYMFEYCGSSFGPTLRYLSDFDCDGERTVLDATLIQRYLTGMSKYSYELTASVELRNIEGEWYACAGSSFGDDPVKYYYYIDGGVHAHSVYGSDFGDFSYNDPDYEPMPGDFRIATGYIDSDTVKLPLESLTYDDSFSLTVRAKDAFGRISDPVSVRFDNHF